MRMRAVVIYFVNISYNPSENFVVVNDLVILDWMRLTVVFKREFSTRDIQKSIIRKQFPIDQEFQKLLWRETIKAL